MERMELLLLTIAENAAVRLVVLAVVMDTIFGIGRAVRQKKFNSSMGIDGAIRKISMLVSLVFLAIVDRMVHINLIGFIPKDARAYLPQSISTIGLVEFFAILYLCYEVTSILKNMALCGLPVKKIWEKVRAFLGKYTDELPDTQEQDEQEEAARALVQEYGTDDVPPGALDKNQDGSVNVYDGNGQKVGTITQEEADAAAEAAAEKIVG